MNTVRANENAPEKSVDWTRRVNIAVKETELESVNRAQESIIQKLEEALHFLKQVQIKNEESLDNIEKPIDDLLSSLKYLPTEPSFDIIPTEIKTDILGYLCDTGAFVAASVCEEWKEILKPSLRKVEAVTIGKHCSNWFQCVDNKCFMPKEILEASITLKLDIPLTVCYPLIDLDSELIIKALSSVNSLNLCGLCDCMDNGEDAFKCTYKPLLTTGDLSGLFESLEEKNVEMDLELRGMEVMNSLNQNRLMDDLLNRIRRLKLDEGSDSIMMDVPCLVRKLLQGSQSLMELTLHHFDHESNLSIDVADALSNVFSVILKPEFRLMSRTLKRLIQNVVTRPVVMRRLTIEKRIIWRAFISPDDLKSLLSNMEVVQLIGRFTPEQVEAAKSLPGVKATLEEVSKL